MWQPFRKAVYLCSTVEEKLSSAVVGAWTLVWKWCPQSLIACNRFTWTVKCGSSAEKESILVQHCWRKALRWCCCWSLSFGMKMVFHLNCSLRQLCRKAVYLCSTVEEKLSAGVVGAWALVWKWYTPSYIIAIISPQRRERGGMVPTPSIHPAPTICGLQGNFIAFKRINLVVLHCENKLHFWDTGKNKNGLSS